MTKFKISGHVLRREEFTIEIEMEDGASEDDARRESIEMWKDGGAMNDDFQFLGDSEEKGFDPDDIEQINAVEATADGES